MVQYRNGKKEIFATRSPAVKKPVVVQKKIVNNAGLASFILSLFSWTLIAAPIAFILGLVGNAQANKEPEKYKGKWMAAFGIVLSGIVLFLILLALIA